MAILDLKSSSLAAMPSAEDGYFEFKSSQTSLKELAKKINAAASGFANSGGGLFLAGVSQNGDADGGFGKKVGNQDILDWVDQAIGTVQPAVSYSRVAFASADGRGSLDDENVVIAIAFDESSNAPHMASDGRYYLRAGAHTAPASAYVVESLFARRASRRPHVAHGIRLKPGHGFVVQLGVVATSDIAAVDVELSIEGAGNRLAKLVETDFPLHLPVVDRSTPFFTDCTTRVDIQKDLPEGSKVLISYKDSAGNSYRYESKSDLIRALPPMSFMDDSLREIAGSLKSIEKKLK